MGISYEKANAVSEVTSAIESLQQLKEKLDGTPRSLTAARQLTVIITKLQGWHAAHNAIYHNNKHMPPSVDEVIKEAVVFLEKRYKH